MTNAKLALPLLCLTYVSLASAFEARWKIDFPGAKLELRALSAGESLECPADLPACPVGASPDGPIVLDPGHDESLAGTRSDPSYIDPPRAPASSIVKFYEPYEGGAKPSSHWKALLEEQSAPLDPNQGFSKYIHEGRGNLAVSILSKYFLDRCVLGRLSHKPAVKLTHWPGERVFGQYEDPSWASRARARVGGEPYIMAESKNEHINKKDDEPTVRYDYNSNWGTPYNSRLLYSNHLLGLKDPFARRAATLEEVEMLQDHSNLLPLGVFNPRDPQWRSNGIFVSIHEDTKPIQVPSGFNGDRKTLRAPDQVLVAYPRVSYQEGALPATLADYEVEPAAGTPEGNPSGAALAQRMGAAVQARMQKFYPDRLPLETQPRPLLVIARNVLVERKVLIEGFDMTGGGRDKIESQIRKRDRRIEVRVTPARGKPTTIELPISDLHVLFAQGVAQAIGAEVCGSR